MMYNKTMRYEWDPNKNKKLKEERNVSFEQIVYHLIKGNIWRISKHLDQQKYPKQELYFVEMDEYIYIVPHIIEKDYIFLKTIIPSRKATKLYKKEKQERENKNEI